MDEQKIKEAYNKMTELEENAITRFLEKTDFDRTEWMTEEELIEYGKLYKLVNGECIFCGEAETVCQCK